MNSINGSISRREFARRAAVASAASMIPASALRAHPSTSESSLQQSAETHSLTSAGQLEAETRYQAILAAYGSRFSEAQKTDLRRLCILAQPPLDRLRAYAMENGDGPALYLKPLVEREKKPAEQAAPRTPGQAAKKP